MQASAPVNLRVEWLRVKVVECKCEDRVRDGPAPGRKGLQGQKLA